MPSPAPRSLPHDHRDAGTGAYTVGVAVVHAPRSRGWWGRLPLRLFGGPGRMIGVDVARGLALLGLLWGALGAGGAGGPLAALVTTALFLLLSGVSASLMLHPATPSKVDASLRVAVRAALLFAAGSTVAAVAAAAPAAAAVAVAAGTGALPATAGPLSSAANIATPATMLQLLGVLTFASLFPRRWRPRTLFIVAAVCLLVLPATNFALASWLHSPPTDPQAPAVTAARALAALLTGTAFPALTWCTPFLVGLAVGRLRRDRIWRPFALLAAGGLLFALALGATLLATLLPASGAGASVPGRIRALLGSSLTPLLAAAGVDTSAQSAPPQPSGVTLITQQAGVVDVLAATAIALAMLAVCLLLAKPLRWLLFPIAALGSTALTASALLLAAALLAPTASAQLIRAFAAALPPALAPWTALLTVLAAWLTAGLLAAIWRALLNAGPLERALAALSSWPVSAARTTAQQLADDPAATESPADPTSSRSPDPRAEPVSTRPLDTPAEPLSAWPTDPHAESVSTWPPDPRAEPVSSWRTDPYADPTPTQRPDPAADRAADPSTSSAGGVTPATFAPSATPVTFAPSATPETSAAWATISHAASSDRGASNPGASDRAAAPELEQYPRSAPRQRFSAILEEPAAGAEGAGAGLLTPPSSARPIEQPAPTASDAGQRSGLSTADGRDADRDRAHSVKSAPREKRTFRDRAATRRQKNAPRRSSFGQLPVEEAAALDRAASDEARRPAAAAGGSAASGAAAGAVREGWSHSPTAEHAGATPPPTPQWSPGQSLGRLPY